MNVSTGIGTSNLFISSTPLLTEYDFRASSFYDGYISMFVMADKIANDMKFEEKLKKLYEKKLRKKGK